MPTLTRWYLKSALVHLAAALAIGALLALRAHLPAPGAVAALSPVYFHVFMVGWVTQLIFGVAHWMFPKPPAAAAARGERLGWLTWGMLNGGLVLRAVAEPGAALRPGPAFGAALAVAAGLQLAAGWLFAATTWPRVRGR